MDYKSIKLVSNSDLGSLIEGLQNGIESEFLLNQNPSTHKEKIIFLADILLNRVGTLGLEVKYLYGRRNKRFELVFRHKKIVYICKLSSFSKFDQDGLELDTVISDIKENSDLTANFRGIVILEGLFDQSILDNFSSKLKNPIFFIPFNPKNQFTTLSNVIFDK